MACRSALDVDDSAPLVEGPCAEGGAVSSPETQPWLVYDCNVLLEARDTLAGHDGLF